MLLSIKDEFSQLTDVVVCFGENVPEFDKCFIDEPEFTKYHKRSWNKSLLLKQQEVFFTRLEHYGVTLHFPQTKPELTQQMYTRDTGFVIGPNVYYSRCREFSQRNGEVEPLLKLLHKLDVNPKNIVELKSGSIEGGDVLVENESVYIGNGSRTSVSAISELGKHERIAKLHLGPNVMHLDTRLTLLPKNYVLIYPEAFLKKDLELLSKKHRFIEVKQSELENLGTNVFFLNPEVIFSPKHNRRINKELKKAGFYIEDLDYTEPVNLGGSFRCTTMPLVRV
jgi:N-dimethylarginine dimethylaminohydrolase